MRDADIDKRLAAFIKEHGTQENAAKVAGVSGAYLSHVLHKKRPIGGKLLKALGLMKVSRITETRP